MSSLITWIPIVRALYAPAKEAITRWWRSLDGPNAIRSQRLSIFALAVVVVLGGIGTAYCFRQIFLAIGAMAATLEGIEGKVTELPTLVARRDAQVVALQKTDAVTADRLGKLESEAATAARETAIELSALSRHISHVEGQISIIIRKVGSNDGSATYSLDWPPPPTAAPTLRDPAPAERKLDSTR